jgi:hypothetical protein
MMGRYESGRRRSIPLSRPYLNIRMERLKITEKNLMEDRE